MLDTLLLVALPLVLPVSAPQDPADVLRAADRDFLQATRERGREGWLAWFAEDAVVFPPSGGLALGAAAVRRHYESQDGFPLKGFVWEPEEAGLASSGDLGWTRGRWGNDANGTPTWTGQYLSVWRKQPDGAWRVVADCGYVPEFATRVAGLEGPPVASGSESERLFRSVAGDLAATAGSWWARDAADTEVGGTFLSLWRRHADGTQERLFTTGIAQARR